MMGRKSPTVISLTLLLLMLLSLAARNAGAQQTAPTTAPATQAAPIQATVTGVVGMVQVREESDKPWVKAQVGMVLGEGAEFRTGPRSGVRLQIPPDQTISLDRLGTFKLLQVLRDGNVVKTRVGMQYGRTRYDIEEAGVQHRSELVTPSSTLAIRGTRVSVFDQPPFAPSAVSLTGQALYTTARRQIAFGGKGQGKSEVSGESQGAAAFSLLQAFVDPTSAFGRPAREKYLISQLQSKGDLVLNNGNLAVAFGGPVSDTQLGNLLEGQGRFNISMRWTGPGDFDLFVLGNDASGQPYTLGNPSYQGSVFKDIGLFGGDPNVPAVTAAQSPDGGRIKFDQVALGGGGLEFASWGQGKNGTVPQQGYTIAIVYYDQRGRIKNYPLRSDFKIDAFLDGKRVPVLTNFDQIVAGTATELKFGPEYTGRASLIDAEKILVVTPPDKLKGDIRVSAVDLTPEALGLDGQPIGNINPSPAAAAKPPRTSRAPAAGAAPSATPKPGAAAPVPRNGRKR